jgi:hypothetical protein
MAPEPQLDDFGALAITPPRVDIFARPAPPRPARKTRTDAPSGVFAATAACRTEPIADVLEEAQPARQRRIHTAGIAAIAGVCAAVAATAAAWRPHPVVAPKAPVEHVALHAKPPAATHRSVPHEQAIHLRHGRGRAHHTRAPRVRRPTPREHPHRLVAPPLTPPVPAPPTALGPRPAPRTPPTSEPPRPIPARVPKGAPPEFM